MITVATFAAWLNEQSGRQDQVGDLARYWAKVTPGRVSSPSGMLRHLTALAEDGQPEHGPPPSGWMAALRAAQDERDGVTRAPLASVPDQAANGGNPVRAAVEHATAAGTQAAQAQQALDQVRAEVRAARDGEDHGAQPGILARLDAIAGMLGRLDRTLNVVAFMLGVGRDENGELDIPADGHAHSVTDRLDVISEALVLLIGKDEPEGEPYARSDSPHPKVHDVLDLDRRYGKAALDGMPADWAAAFEEAEL